MGYLHIDNLYKNQDILLVKKCVAMEKVHGTSAHIQYIPVMAGSGEIKPPSLAIFSGGESHTKFAELFNTQALLDIFIATTDYEVTVYGEAYGGKCQGMSATYGKELKFIAFDVRIGDYWLSVDKAAEFCSKLGIEFVPYEVISTEQSEIDRVRDADSEVAIRRGMGPGKKREGVVLRPLVELRTNGDHRIIAKHKRAEFKETATPRELDPAKLQVLTEAKAIADEWVTPMRLEHVLDKLPEDKRDVSAMGDIIRAMVEDVLREGRGEIRLDTEASIKEFERAVGKATAILVKKRTAALLSAPKHD